MQVLGVSPEDPDASRELYEEALRAFPPGAVTEAALRESYARTKRAKGSARKLLHAGGSRSLSAEALEQAPAAAAPGVRAAPQDASPAAGPAPLQQKAAATFGASTAGGTAMNAPTVPLPAAAQPRAEESGQQPAVAAPEQAAAAAAGAGAARPLWQEDDAGFLDRMKPHIANAIAEGADGEVLLKSVLAHKRGTAKGITNAVWTQFASFASFYF